MPEMVARLKISPQSYVFTVVTCGSMAGNCVWVLRRLLRKKGIELAYSHKVSMPDNSALAFGRNPNKQLGKYERVPARMEQIIRELQNESHTLHYSWFGLLSWLLGRRQVYRLWNLRACLSDEQYNSPTAKRSNRAKFKQRKRSNRRSRSVRCHRRPLYRMPGLCSCLCTAGHQHEW